VLGVMVMLASSSNEAGHFRLGALSSSVRLQAIEDVLASNWRDDRTDFFWEALMSAFGPEMRTRALNPVDRPSLRGKCSVRIVAAKNVNLAGVDQLRTDQDSRSEPR
jgi:hypothetical protein